MEDDSAPSTFWIVPRLSSSVSLQKSCLKDNFPEKVCSFSHFPKYKKSYLSVHIEKGEPVQPLLAGVENRKVQAENGEMKKSIGKGREAVEFVVSFGGLA